MWWKRILTVVMMLLTLGQAISLPEQLVVKAKAAEVNHEDQIESIFEETENSEEKNYDIIEYEGYQYKIPHLSLNREPGVTESGYVEKITEVPQYFQTYYPDTKYGYDGRTVRNSGCGIACLSMVLTYLLDEEIKIEDLANKYSRYSVPGGSSFNLFDDSAKDYGVNVKQVYNWEEVKEALKNGQVVIANPREKSFFTKGGHFIVLFGITEDSKILVRDPNLYNYSIWNYPECHEGYANGFKETSINYCFPMWIYDKKDLEAVAARAAQFEKHNLTTNDTEDDANP